MPNYKSDHKFSEIDSLSVAQRAYLAGIIDADGTITVTTKKCKDGSEQMPDVMVLLVNTNFPLIEWLKETIGYGCAYFTKGGKERPDQDRRNWRPVHRYQLTGRAARNLLIAIRPFLIVKAENADLCISIPRRGVDYSHRSTPEQLAQAMEAVAKVRQNNRRGLAHERQVSD